MLLRFFFLHLLFMLNFLLIMSINIETNYTFTLSNGTDALKTCRNKKHALA